MQLKMGSATVPVAAIGVPPMASAANLEPTVSPWKAGLVGAPPTSAGGRFCALLDSGSPENYFPGMNYRERITIDSRIRSGKPCIRGTRITVADVFDYLGGGMTIPEVLDDFPDLTADDIQACFAFAADRDRRLNVVPHEVAL